MAKKFSWKYLTCAMALCLSAEASDNILMPLVELSLTPPPAGDYGAFSFFGELGDRNYRGSGTYGVYFTPCQRLKITGEYLAQRLEYPFLTTKYPAQTRHKKEWSSQYAIGGAYQYLLPSSAFESIDFGASYSHAFDENLNKYNRLAGSDGGFAYLGTTIEAWRCGYFSPAVNYDYVKYRRQFQSNRFAKGWGGTLNYVQLLPRDLTLNLEAEIRQPFYFYEGSINWSQKYNDLGVSLGIYTNYTDGRKGLPNVLAGGFQIGFSYGGKSQKCCRTIKSETSAPSEAMSENKSKPENKEQKNWYQDCYPKMYCDVMNWVASPAVYMPVVLAIPEKRESSEPSSDPIPGVATPQGTYIPYDVSRFFFSPVALTFSATGLQGSGLSINPRTGVISGLTKASKDGKPYTITVTGKSSYGSTSQTFNWLVTSSGSGPI